MSTFSLIFITGMISFAVFGAICITGRHSSAEAQRFTARNRTLFFRSFPLLTGFTIITLVTAFLFVFFTILKNHTSDRISKIMDIEFALKDIIIPFLIMIGISLPISIMNYKTASIELKNTYPFLNISILLIAVFNSLTISLIISLLLKR